MSGTGKGARSESFIAQRPMQLDLMILKISSDLDNAMVLTVTIQNASYYSEH